MISRLVSWKDELTAATIEALHFSGLEPQAEWTEYTPRRASNSAVGRPRIHGPSQRDAWRTMRNQRGQCAMRDCGAAIADHFVRHDGFLYCSDAHATADLDERAADP